MTNKVISYSVILKRSNCLNSKAITESSSNSDVIFDRIKPSLNKPILNIAEKKMITSYLNALACIEEANSSYYKALDIIDCIQEDSFRTQLITQFNERVLPYVQDLSYIADTLKRYENLTESEKDSVQNAAIGYNISDRILKNHAFLSKRFNIENEITKYNYKNLHDIVERCGSMIDTYSMEAYKKLNICVEEMCYLLEKNGYKYDKAQLVQYITEYFILVSPDLSSRDINNFKRALEESYLLESSDLINIEYLFDKSTKEPDSITDLIECFYKTPNKEEIDFDLTQGYILDSKTSILDIQVNIGRYIRFLWNVFSSGLYSDDQIESNCVTIAKIISNKLSNGAVSGIHDNNYIPKQTIVEIINTIEKELAEFVVYNDTDNIKADKINTFKLIINDNLISPLKDIADFIYNKNNLVAMEAANKINTSGDETETAKKFKIFKFNNLIKASINLDRLLKSKEKALLNRLVPKGKKILAKVNNVLFGESSDIYEFIGEDNRVDITVAQYYYNEEFISDLHEFFDNIIKECNNKLRIDGNDTISSYYIMNPGIIEVHIKDSTFLELTEEDKDIIAKTNDSSLDVYIESLALVDSVMEAYSELSDEKTISEMINDIDESFDFEHYELAMEAMKYLSVSKDDTELFTEKYSAMKVASNGNNYNTINESKQVHSIYETWEAYEEVPIDVQLEAYQLLLAIMEDAKNVNKGKLSLANSTFNKTKDSTDYSGKTGKFDLKKTKNDPDFDKQKKLTPDQERELKKNPFKGININSIRLFLKGLNSKMGKMSQKERELSKQLDANFRRFVKSMKDALISDRREAIIKGSVIPSFSKCLKIAGALAAVGKVAAIGTGAAFNPVAPLVIALGGFAMSKRLTKKERLLLLDDIEIELEVLDKEISSAESQNQMKKLRALMKYKKDLQRQYQRIRYNVRVGKDLLPNSSVGLKETD